MSKEPLRIVILVAGKGRGSNMQAVIDACKSGYIDGEVSCVISTSLGSPALERAREQNIPTRVVPYVEDIYETALLDAIDECDPGLILLAGYLRKLPASVVRRYAGRIMNIHPALIPSFCGQGMYGERVHQAVIDSGVRYSGCTVHFVDEEYDTGPIIMQAVVDVDDCDDAHSLALKVLREEHRIFPECVKLFAEGRLETKGRRVKILPAPSPAE